MQPITLFTLILLIGCNSTLNISTLHPVHQSNKQTDLIPTLIAAPAAQRDSIATAAILNGQSPDFLWKFVPIHVTIKDKKGKPIHATYYVSPDYLAIGNTDQFLRMPLTPLSAQKIADYFHCFLPTPKIVNTIYEQAVVQLPPVPLFAFRDSSISFWHHQLIIEGQRKGKKGLIAGIKKDVVLTDRLHENQSKKVAIYGWHQLNGKPIQPLYTGHASWYTDYSHGIRLVYEKIKINGKWFLYTAILKDPDLRKILCDESNCNVYKYQ